MLRHALAPVNAAAASALGLPRTIATDGNDVAITFDDGPHPEGTPAILEILAQHQATATFFVIGEQVARRPELAQRIRDQGHAVALHGYRHRLQLRLSAQELEDDLARGTQAIQDAAGITPTRHRPPYGIYSPAGLRIARENGLEPLLWSAWGKDWRASASPRSIVTTIATGQVDGGVVLLHDSDLMSATGSWRNTAAALPLLADHPSMRGLTVAGLR